MVNIFITVILIIAAAIALGMGVTQETIKDRYGEESTVDKMEWKIRPRMFWSLVLVITIIPSCITFVKENNVGIQYDPFRGGVSEKVLAEGVVYKLPTTKIFQLSTEVQTKKILKIPAQTKDSQFYTMDLDVKYRVNQQHAYEVFKQYRNIENIDINLIVPNVQRAIEQVSTQYNIIEILGEKRNEIYALIEKELDKRFAGTGIDIRGITFSDTDGGSEIEAAIRAEAVAKKNVDIAEQNKLVSEINKQKEIMEAEANKKVSILKAEAEAEAVRIIQEQLSKNPTYIDYIRWSRWDGKLPEVMGTDSIITDTRK